jgi:FkbM family methyltransferase
MWRRELRDEHALQMVLATILRTDSNAIDIGANEGAVLESIVRIAPRGRHVAFEPIPNLHEDLTNRFPDVDVRRAALSDTCETTEFAHVVDAPAYSGLRQREDLPRGAGKVQHIPVHTERLDDVLEDAYVPTLLKIDVEGAELQVMRGAVETLQKHRPWVLFEHGTGGADVYGTHPTEVFDLLDTANLRIFDLEGDGPYSRDQFEATFTEPIWNFLAAPA